MKYLRKFPYWQLLAIPALLFSLGFASNMAVLVANHGKFPVRMNELQYEAHCPNNSDDEDAPPQSCVNGGQFLDREHSVMGPNSHLKVLADILPLGKSIYSIGDELQDAGEYLWMIMKFMWLALVIRKAAQNQS